MPLMNDDLLAEGLIQRDETYLQVLHSEKQPLDALGPSGVG